jgi:membrane fusion protein (multidrug efflux system)
MTTRISAFMLVVLLFSGCQTPKDEESHLEQHKILLTSPMVEDIVVKQQYVCQIHSQRHIEIRALQEGYLEAITLREGQTVKKKDILFKVIPAFYKARLDAENAEADFARVEFNNTEKLHEKNVVSSQELALYKAKLAKAEAKAKLAAAELRFTEIEAPFDGIIDNLRQQQGSLVKKEEILTTLSDNSLMWVYFNVPEVRYLEYKAHQGKTKDISRLKLDDSRIELMLAGGAKFEHTAGDTVTVLGQFNNETGNIRFRADISNPDGLLRHGQTGTVVIHHKVKDAIVIPQRATFEILDKQYVWVVGEDHVAHQRPITIQHELEDKYVLKSGLKVNDKFVLEGVQYVHEGQKLDDIDFEKPSDALTHQKYHAE